MSKMIKWVSTGELNTRVLRAKMPGGNVNLVLFGVKPDDFSWSKAIEGGFSPTKSGSLLFRNGGVFTLTEIRKIFPSCFILDVPEESTYLSMVPHKPAETAAATQEEKKSIEAINTDERVAAIEMTGYVMIGANYLGQEVHEDSAGNRFVVSSGASRRISEKDISGSGAFLRATDEESLALCADGFILQMLSGKAMSSADVARFASAIYGEKGAMPATDSRLRVVQEAIEASNFRNFSKNHRSASIADFTAAMEVEELQPVMSARTSTSVDLQQYSTPLSMSIAAQSVLSGLIKKDSRILEPAIGNASLVSTLDCQITGYDLDPARVARAKLMNAVSEMTIEHRDFLSVPLPEKKYDAVISNPPFGGLTSRVDIEELSATRLDHLFLMRSLQMRADNGVAVFIIGGDFKSQRTGQHGKLDGGSKNLFNWLADHYEMTAFEIDGSLYAKQGASFPVRMVSVGKRVSAEEAASRRKTGSHRIGELAVVKTSQALWDAAQASRAFLIERNNILTEESSISTDLAVANEVFDVNEFQVSYTPASNVGEASSVIPINLAIAQRRAFERLTTDVGDVDTFVAAELNLQVEDLGKLFTPEQVDAIALGIWNIQRGRGLILGDQTGQGKGRVMAAIALYAAVQKYDGVFLTEKPNLFSDLWRDISDIGADDSISPMLVNADAAIIDFETGEPIYRTAPAAVKTRLFGSQAGEISIQDEGYTTMLATYSQFNRPPEKLVRSKWLASVQRDSILMLDESHNAAGESHTGINVASSIENAAGAIYSSATFAKDVKNFRVYGKAFPKSVNLDTLEQTLAVGGEPLMEVLASMLTEDGAMICRQSDISNLNIITTAPSEAIYKRNRELAASMSEILLAMSNFSGDVNNLTEVSNKEMRKALEKMPEEQRKGNRMGVRSVNFGSRLYNINRQFLLAIAMDTIIDRAKKSLQSGEKPSLVIEQTMESVMRDLMADDETGEVNNEGDAIQTPLMFRDLLFRMLDKIQEVVINNGYGKVERTTVFELAKNDMDAENARAAVAGLSEMIAAFPDLSCNPIDDFRNALEADGWKTGEISGRSLRVVRDAEGNHTFLDQGKINRARIVFDFNAGKTDALVITRAGSTGLSLHASEKFKDQRRRRMLEGQIANDVNVRTQFFGRFNRRGQTSVPEIESITSGLPCEVRNLSMQNHKLRKLSANTTSNRNNKAEINDCPDILNKIGNMVCFYYLMENPEISAKLGVELDREDEENAYFVNKLTGYIMLLHPDVQEKVFADIFALYNDKMSELTMKGENPFEDHVLDVKATITDSFTLSAGSGDSVFDAPVIAEKLEWHEDVEPVRFKLVRQLSQLNGDKFAADMRSTQKSDIYEYLSSFWIRDEDGQHKQITEQSVKGFLGLANQGFLDLMKRSLPKSIKDKCELDFDAGIKIALGMNDDNIIKAVEARRVWMNQNLKDLTPLHQIQFTHYDEPAIGVIVSLIPPTMGDEHYLGRWSVRVAVPGKEDIIEMSLSQIMNDAKFAKIGFNSTTYSQMESKFNSAPNGKISFSKWVLSGNLFAAAEIAAANGFGRAGSFTDKNGLRYRAILCRSSVDKQVLAQSRVPVSSAAEACEIMLSEIASGRGILNLDPGFSLSWNKGQMTVKTPGGKASGGSIYLNSALIAALGTEFSGSRKSMAATFDVTEEKMRALMDALYREGMTIPRPAAKPLDGPVSKG